MSGLVKNQIIIASLLHDIGKFWQRGDDFISKSENLDKEVESWGWLVPTNPKSGNPGYQHAIWTYQFLENKKASFDKLGLWNNAEKISELSAKHHLPDTLLQAMIQMADWWSSGIDRNALASEEDVVKSLNIDWGKFAFKKVPLHSIFDQMQVNGVDVNGSHAYRLRALDISSEEAVFPFFLSGEETEKLKADSLRKDYEELWKQFDDEFDKLPTGNYEAFSTSLLYLLKKYTWCIPSSTVDVPNVSLFEHLKTTAAIAGCLYDHWQENPESFKYENKRINLNEGVDPLLMCCLDLSGIQSFIYDVASSKAYKSLKGRSFYLQLMLEQALSFILTGLGQGLENIIYSSGGKAYFLLPNTLLVKGKLPSLLKELEKSLWKEHNGKIFAVFGKVSFRYDFTPGSNNGLISSQEIGPDGIAIEELGRLWKAVSDITANQKSRRFSSLVVEEFEELFTEDGRKAFEAQETEICAVTGEPIIGEYGFIGKKGEEIKVLPEVEAQTKLGAALKDCDFLISYAGEKEDTISASGKGAGVYFPKIQRHGHLFRTAEELEGGELFRKMQSRPQTTFLSINDSRFLWSSKPAGSQAGYGFMFYGGNKQPEISDDGNFRTRALEELCWHNAENENDGYSKLGILRMDVDNLGQLFINGFPEHQKSFAGYGTLSFQLDLFFSGYLNTIRNSQVYKDHVAILYSGGDDVFAVGRWDKVLGFALEVRQKFQRFVGRSDISISAGLAIVDRKYPIYKAAEIAGDAEKAAKNYKGSSMGLPNKNAITFFSETVSWEREFPEVKELKERLVYLCETQNMSRSLLHQLQRYKAFRDESEWRHKEKGEPVDFSYKWHSAYYLERFAERYKKNGEILKAAEELQSRLLHDKAFGPDRFLSLAALAARWAEYELKMKN